MTSTLTNPIPVTTTNIRPFVNNDVTNNVAYKHGLPRPLKWNYRLGHINTVTLDSSNKENYLKTSQDRYVRSSRTGRLLAMTMDRPGHVTESFSNANLSSDLARDARMDGLKTDCCQATKALRRVRGSSTNIDKAYYQTEQQYRHSRCKTIKQKSYQFTHDGGDKYLSNCSTTNCNQVVYKPSNQQFATQGAVSSSARTLRLTLNTAKTEMQNYKSKATANNFANRSGNTNVPFILKAKSSIDNLCPCPNVPKRDVNTKQMSS